MSTETDLEDAIRRCDGSAVLEIMRRVAEGRTEPLTTNEDEAVECARDIAIMHGSWGCERDVAVIRAYGNVRYAEGRRDRRQDGMREVAEAWDSLSESEFERWLGKQVKP